MKRLRCTWLNCWKKTGRMRLAGLGLYYPRGGITEPNNKAPALEGAREFCPLCAVRHPDALIKAHFQKLSNWGKTRKVAEEGVHPAFQSGFEHEYCQHNMSLLLLLEDSVADRRRVTEAAQSAGFTEFELKRYASNTRVYLEQTLGGRRCQTRL